MSLEKLQLLLVYFDDIKIVHVDVLQEQPLKVSIGGYDREYFTQADEFRAVVGDERKVHAVAVVEHDDDCITIELGDHISEHVMFDYHTIDYKEDVSIALLKKDGIMKYNACADKINTRERNNLSMRIKSILNREDVENPELISFLVEINSKLDEMLSYMRPKDEIDGLFNVKCLLLSGSGMVIYADRDIRGADNIFMTTTLTSDGGRFTFACLCDFAPVKVNIDGTGLYIATFDRLSDEVRDNVIKLIFSLEREALKNAKKRMSI